jgi:uncharacterized protein YbjQ (UPF0145 family)
MAMLLTTTDNVAGKTIEYLGIVNGEAIMPVSLFGSIASALDNNKDSRKKEFVEGKDIALTKLQTDALRLGANAVIGIALHYDTAKKGVITVIATGTAVKLS